MSSKPTYLEALRSRVLIFDGAMGTSIDQFGLSAEDYGGERTYGNRDYLAIARPDVIEQIHTSFMEAGCDVLETNTFQSTRLRLAEWGLADRTAELNIAAARLARRVAERFAAQDGRPRYVAGSIGPTGKLPSSNDPALSDITFDELSEIFREQAAALIAGGVDVLLVETSVDILEVKAALDGIRRAKHEAGAHVAVQAQIFLDLSGRMLLGTEVPAVIATLEAMPVDVIGLNCSTGPEHMREAIQYLCAHSRLPISCIPNAGLPLEVDGETVYPMEPEPFARILGEFVREYGVSAVGGCCGTRPAHIRALRAAVGYERAPAARQVEYIPSVSSGVKAAALRQDVTLTMIGERVNTLGSRKVKRLLLNDDYDGVLDVAREQADGGAHLLDVCVATTERADEREQMVALLKKLTMNVELPLAIDTTEADVLKAALEIYPGRAIVNSLSLEGGRGEKLDRTMPLVARYGAAAMAMTIDEDGMAHTAGRKLAVARRIAQIARDEYGVPHESLIFDVLTFPITTGQDELRRAAIETIEGIRLVKQHIPGCFTTLGVSNLSFGVAPHARAALNSVFLKHAVDAGLDTAIINPAHVTPYAEIPAEQRELCEDLIFDRRDEALARFIQFFEQNAAAVATARADPTAGLSVAERLHWKIVHRVKEGVEEDVDVLMAQRLGLSVEDFRLLVAGSVSGDSDSTVQPANVQTAQPPSAVPRGDAAVDILNNVLLPAMKEVGDLFGSGQLILPFVLQSAEVMKKTVAYLERYLDKLEGATKGKVVLATVYGDVHDIGKNLVHTILANNGYTVYDLGKQVPLNTIIEKAVEVGADAIGLSALLVSTSKQMPLCVQELHRRGLSFPVLVGGAAINQQYGQRITFVADEEPYAAGVFYCKDAFEGLETMDKLSNTSARARFVEQTIRDAAQVLHQKQRGRVALADLGRATRGDTARSAVRRDVPVPTPPFWGAQVVKRIKLQDVVDCLDRNALFRLQWGAKNAKGAEWEKLKAGFELKVRDLIRAAEREGWLEPQVVYGYFPAQADGNELVVYDPASLSIKSQDSSTGKEHGSRLLALGSARELTRFVFPRQPGRERLCLADYFRPAESGEYDVAAFQIVTMGARVDDLTEELQKAGDYSSGYFIHGLSVSLAEALAEYTNRVVRQSLGLKGEQGKRYSWGYPACPDLDEHAKLFGILPADRIGVTLTDAFQLVPEQSTAAIVVHHPEAKYFSIGSAAERAEQDVGAVA
ncbi:MAG TPA: homocysteine S-methyltransferase family protein [Kouleothrix sp.]|uniref:homocysteine S-methyltransferase family protein n=1 Tax=Kouleothrix sp. TaxID=2779161 RepID=UPI002B758E7A|nr:homocysteine S-methyltransferase family protein [Kouleothrix sp.]